MKRVAITGQFDDLRSADIRYLQEASKLGDIQIRLWSDAVVRRIIGRDPKFPFAERRYFVGAVRFVKEVVPADGAFTADELPPAPGLKPDLWAMHARDDRPMRHDFCRAHGITFTIIRDESLHGYPPPPEGILPPAPGRAKVLVTGCYDWFHSGHVRFFEEVNELGDVYVVVGSDANLALLKGPGHPMFPARQRLYIANSIRWVRQAFVSTGTGWLDAEPEIERIQPDIYAVNEDGDKPEKREYCEQHGIRYVVLSRQPAPGLAPRSSTDLRGF